MTNVKSLLEMYVKMGGSLTDTYSDIAGGVPVGQYSTISDAILACSKKYSAGGGGGAEKFVVTLTSTTVGDKTTWTADKTLAKIAEAYEDGQAVVANYPDVTLGNLEIPILAINGQEGLAVFGATFTPQTETISLSIVGFVDGDSTEWNVSQKEIAEVPSYSSSNNGQVLGVDNGNLAWVDVAPLIVTLTAGQEAGQYVGNMTFAEIHAAATAGRSVVFVVNIEGDEYVMYCISSSVVVESSNTVYQVYYINAGDIAHFDGGASDYPSLS